MNYGDAYFRSIDAGSFRSADVVTRMLAAWLKFESVLDVGCGRGVWVAAWIQRGAERVFGVDGDYQLRVALHIPAANFLSRDLTQPFHLGATFSLVMSLEVAEHLPESSADGFVDSLTAHGDVVYFSAAPRGQGGTEHVNEQPYEYWRRKFQQRGFSCYDCLRPMLRSRPNVEPWYRFNSFLYVRDTQSGLLPRIVRERKVPSSQPLIESSPLWWRARCALLRRLPEPVVTQLSQAKHRLRTVAGSGSAVSEVQAGKE